MEMPMKTNMLDAFSMLFASFFGRKPLVQKVEVMEAVYSSAPIPFFEVGQVIGYDHNGVVRYRVVAFCDDQPAYVCRRMSHHQRISAIQTLPIHRLHSVV